MINYRIMPPNIFQEGKAPNYTRNYIFKIITINWRVRLFSQNFLRSSYDQCHKWGTQQPNSIIKRYDLLRDKTPKKFLRSFYEVFVILFHFWRCCLHSWFRIVTHSFPNLPWDPRLNSDHQNVKSCRRCFKTFISNNKLACLLNTSILV